MSGKFRNPYNFVPLRAGKICDQLEQGKPQGHHQYHDDLWSGRIEIDIETVTPLLIPDAANVDVKENGHKVFDVRRGLDGRPLLPVTTLKGMLRSAYEMVTNSRFGVFNGHDAPPARRMQTQEAAVLVPARIAGGVAELWVGDTPRQPNWQSGDALHAAWLPFRASRKLGVSALFRPSDSERMNGVPVTVRVQRIEHERWDKRRNQHSRDFDFWEVVSIVRGHGNYADLDRKARSMTNGDRSPRRSVYTPTSDFLEGNGWVSWSNFNIDRKHDERVFFMPKGSEPTLTEPLTDKHAERWKHLINDYKKVFARDGKREDVQEASRHICVGGTERLEEGTLCYARLEPGPPGQRPRVSELYPVMISRELGHTSPERLLPSKWRPAVKLTELSPADRVFGWVNQDAGDGHNAYKGQLRISEIKCKTEPKDAIETFAKPLPLAILGAPKVSQARFYVGEAETSEPLDSKKDANLGAVAYFDKAAPRNYQLRGMKVYPHHAATVTPEAIKAGYWNGNAALDEAQKPTVENGVQATRLPVRGAEYREYVRRSGMKVDNRGKKTAIANADQQNRSIKAWVKPGTKFTASIDVINLNEAELAVLLWLLDLERECGDGGVELHHRLGGGKPLGFGSVKIKIHALNLATGAVRGESYRSLFGALPAPVASEHRITNSAAAGKLTDRFLTDVSESVGEFDKLPHVKAFLQAATGYEDAVPTHYPRMSPAPDPAGENFKWFGANEDFKLGFKVSLPMLAEKTDEDDRTLPLFPQRTPKK